MVESWKGRVYGVSSSKSRYIMHLKYMSGIFIVANINYFLLIIIYILSQL